jgi:hypothetical protein
LAGNALDDTRFLHDVAGFPLGERIEPAEWFPVGLSHEFSIRPEPVGEDRRLA